MPVRWNGDRLLRTMATAQERGLNQTMSEAVLHAKENHTWQNRSGTLEGSIQTQTFAEPVQGGGFRGVWGSVDVRYAIVHELGSPSQNIPPRPYLRPAADATYGRLAGNINRQYRKMTT